MDCLESAWFAQRRGCGWLCDGVSRDRVWTCRVNTVCTNTRRSPRCPMLWRVSLCYHTSLHCEMLLSRRRVDTPERTSAQPETHTLVQHGTSTTASASSDKLLIYTYSTIPLERIFLKQTLTSTLTPLTPSSPLDTHSPPPARGHAHTARPATARAGEGDDPGARRRQPT